MEFPSFDLASKHLVDKVEEAFPNVLEAIAVQMAKDARQLGLSGGAGTPNSIGQVYAGGRKTKAPGALSASALKTPSSLFKQGVVRWSTAYAGKVYNYNPRNPHQTKWDINTWEEYSEDYIQMGVKIFNKEL